MADRVIYAMYDDDDVTKDAAKALVADGIHISDVFSPFPIHGIDPIIGVKTYQDGYCSFHVRFNRFNVGFNWNALFHDC